MAKPPRTVPQNYPRIQDENSPYYGCLDDSALAPHQGKVPAEQLKSLIRRAIVSANRKSSREILSIPADATPEQVAAMYERKGRELFRYFKKYVGDPAATAHQIYGKHYRSVGIEQFRNRTLQKERMNSVVLSSDQFRPFFANYTYEEAMTLILEVLISSVEPDELPGELTIPDQVLDAFGNACFDAGLVDEAGRFNNPYRLLEWFLH